MGHVVRWWNGQPGAQLRGPVGGGRPGQDGRAVGGRGGGGPQGLLSRAPGDGEPPGPWPERARYRPGRRRRHLHADGPRDRSRHARLREARGHLPPHLLRLRRRCGGHPPPGRRGEGRDHRRRHRTAGPGGADEGDGRRGGRGQPLGATGRGVVETRPDRHAVGRPAGRGMGSAPRRPVDPIRHGAPRPGAPPVHRLHVGDDGQAEGLRPCPRGIAGEDRGGGRLSGRPPSRRNAVLGHGPRVDHGSLGDRGRRRARGNGVPLRRRPEPPRAGPDLGHGRAPPHHHPGHLTHPHPRPDPGRGGSGPKARPFLAAHPGVHRRAVEPRPLSVVPPRDRRRPMPHHQHLGRHRGGSLFPLAAADHRAEAVHASRPRPGHGRRRMGTRRAAGPARRGGRAGLQEAVARDDPRDMEGPPAVPGHLLEPVAGRVGPRGLGQRGPRRVLVPPRAIRRHDERRRQARRPGGGGERPGPSSRRRRERRGGHPRRGQGRGHLVLRGCQARADAG